MSPTRNLNPKVGDRVSIRYTVGATLSTRREVVKSVLATKATDKVVYADNHRFSKTSLQGLDGYEKYVFLGVSTPEEIKAWDAVLAEERKKREAIERRHEEFDAKRAELQALIEPLGGYVMTANTGDGWAIDGLSEEAIRKIGQLLRKDNV